MVVGDACRAALARFKRHLNWVALPAEIFEWKALAARNVVCTRKIACMRLVPQRGAGTAAGVLAQSNLTCF